MTGQLNLLGDQAAPDDTRLGVIQRLIVRRERDTGKVTADEAGAIAHQHRGRHGEDERCVYCARDGKAILQRLRARQGDTTPPAPRRRGSWLQPGARASIRDGRR